MVFAVRNDLKMTKGKMCAQVAHAAVDAVQQVRSTRVACRCKAGKALMQLPV
jgi:peptidyl-tRNA hydrolase